MIDVQKIAKLARLDLTASEKKKFSRELSSILNYIGQLNEVNTAQVEPTAQVTGLVNVMREDEIEPSNKETREGLLNEVPDRDGDFVKVKSVF